MFARALLIALLATGAMTSPAMAAQFRINPTSGPAGTVVDIYRTGYPRSRTGAAYFAGVKFATVTTNRYGNFFAKYKVPAKTPGGYVFKGTVAGVTAAKAFTVTGTPSPPPPPPTGVKSTTVAAGTPILSDADAAAHVTRTAWEPRPENFEANNRVPSADELAAFRAASNQQSHYANFVTGNFTGTTDEIIQWAAWKWGLDEDLIRAEAHHESTWRQSAHGDVGNGESWGLMQIKQSVWRGTYPLTTLSTPFNVDMYGAILRHCYDGYESWMASRGYVAGDLWGCVGWYYSGDWKDPGALAYAAGVQQDMADRPWERY